MSDNDRPAGWVTPEQYQRQALAAAFKTDPDMENMSRMKREEPARYAALDPQLRLKHAFYIEVKKGAGQ